MNLEGEIETKKVEAFTQRKSGLQEDIEHLRKEAEELKALRKATKRHITYDELPNEARFDRLSTQSKHFIDTIKMVAYRAETAMAQILRRKMTRHDDARSLLRAVYNTEAWRPRPSRSGSIRRQTTLRTKPSDISATNSTAPRRSFPAQNCA